MYDSDEITEAIQRATELIKSATRPSAFTGAGMSQESGIPTYRQEKGSVWDEHDIDEVGTAFAWHLNPQKVWDFWMEQCKKMQAANPNAGHLALSQMENKHLSGLPIITQNIDDLHERSGSRNVIHLHGKLMQKRCSRYCKGVPSLVADNDLVYSSEHSVPLCPHCGELIRPDVILFGEYLHAYPMEQAEMIIDQTDLMIIIGTSGLVAPASKIPLRAQDNGARLIEVNPSRSRITPNVDIYIPLSSGEALTQILNLLEKDSINSH